MPVYRNLELLVMAMYTPCASPALLYVGSKEKKKCSQSSCMHACQAFSMESEKKEEDRYRKPIMNEHVVAFL